MEKTKITNKDMFGMIADAISEIENLDYKEEMLDFIDKKIAQLDAKGKNKKETAAQKENKRLAEIIMTVLSGMEQPATATKILKEAQEQKVDDAFVGMSNQKIAALLKLLVNDGKVIKTQNKKTSYFSIAGTEIALNEDDE